MDFSMEDWAEGLGKQPNKRPTKSDEDIIVLPEGDDDWETVEKTAVSRREMGQRLSGLRGGMKNSRSQEAADSTAEPAKSMSLFEWMEAAIFALIALALVFAFVMRTVGVDGTSMINTLNHGDKLLLSSWWYVPKRGDIVVIRRADDEPLIKRVIACAGDRLDIDETTGKVILNGKELEEPYLDCLTPREGFTGEVVVPDGCVFVMGDNRVNSRDSRDPSVGFVEEGDIMGKALFRIAPFSAFGSIYGNE